MAVLRRRSFLGENVRYLEQLLGPEALANIGKLVDLFEVSQRDVMTILLRYALEQISEEEAVARFADYKSGHGMSSEAYHSPGSEEHHKIPRRTFSRQFRRLRNELASERHHARHDDLTGMFNRRAGMGKLRHDPVAMVAICDVDRFKAINDEWGHEVGDQVLQAVGARFTYAMGKAGTAFRNGGDEFMLVWPELPADPLAEMARIRSAVNASLHLSAAQVRVHDWQRRPIEIHPSISTGVARLGKGVARCGMILLSSADRAMYEAKQNQNSNSIVVVTLTGNVPTEVG